MRGYTALPRSTAPDMMTTHNQHKNVTTHTETYSSTVGQAQSDNVVPPIGNKAPFSDLLKPFYSEDHNWKQLEKLQCGPTPFIMYRSVKGMPFLPPSCLSCVQRVLCISLLCNPCAARFDICHGSNITSALISLASISRVFRMLPSSC